MTLIASCLSVSWCVTVFWTWMLHLSATLLFVVDISLLTSLKELLCHGQLKVKQSELLLRVKLVSS